VQPDVATKYKTVSEETANSQRSKLASALRAISLAASIVSAFRLIAVASTLRGSDRHNTGAIQSGSLAQSSVRRSAVRRRNSAVADHVCIDHDDGASGALSSMDLSGLDLAREFGASDTRLTDQGVDIQKVRLNA